jgi:methoxymalonate biosynthesis acyl carrier protein
MNEQIEARIIEFFRSKGRAQGLEYDTDLFKGGFVDSLFAFEVVVFLEETFGVKIENRQITLENFRCVRAIADTVRRAGGV